MKKLISVFLCIVMAALTIVPCFAADTADGEVPVIMIRGDAEHIFGADGTEVYPLNINTKELGKDIAGAVFPYYPNALFFNKWEEYYEALAAVPAKYFKNAMLDENGEASNGSGISAQAKKEMAESALRDTKKINGHYALRDYQLRYDWRLDPLYVAKQLHDYIEKVKATTGAKKVSLYGVCLGGVFILAYLGKYGSDGIKSVFFDSTVGNGCELYSDLITGKMEIDVKAVNRYYADAANPTNGAGPQILKNMDEFVREFIGATVDVMVKNGTLKVGVDCITSIYEMFYEEMTPRFVMASLGTWPGYWGTVKAADYQAAIKMVFGEEGSKMRTQYAGLIEKLDEYDRVVRQRIPEILLTAKENGCRVGIIAKYGYQQIPIYEGSSRPGDDIVAFDTASFGATTSSVAGQFDDAYVNARIAEGKGKYISPDRQIDLSTALFPETTWAERGLRHGAWPYQIEDLALRFLESDTEFTNETDPNFPAFLKHIPSTGEIVPMEGEPTDIMNWEFGEEKTGIKGLLKAVLRWFKALFRLIENRMAKEK